MHGVFHRIPEAPMSHPHLHAPSYLRNDAAYAAALDELEDLMLAEPGTPGGQRFDELVVLIEDYEAWRDGYDLARMKRALAGED
jgi:hypothetical protein